MRSATKRLATAAVAAAMSVLLSSGVAIAQSETDPVQGVFFFSPTCGHCEYVMMEVLPGIFDDFGGSAEILFDESIPAEEVAFYRMSNGTLEILLVDVTKPAGSALYNADIERQSIPDSHWGVPRLSMDDGYWVGSVEIPETLPLIIAQGIAAGGMAYPEISGLEGALATTQPRTELPQTTVAPTTTAPDRGTDAANHDTAQTEATTSSEAVDPFAAVGDETWTDRFGEDPMGNSISVLVLTAMTATLVVILWRLGKGIDWGSMGWIVPILAVLGFGVAAYLGIVETSGADAVCGPVGDCNAVQQSEYAELLGIPIGVIGMLGYAGILISWGMAHFGRDAVSRFGSVSVAAIALGGTLFSMYLTFLEPFVIGATCMWCITSALVITALAWLTASPGWTAFQGFRT